MPMEVTIAGRGALGRLEDFIWIATQAYIGQEFKDYRTALEMIIGIAQTMAAEYDQATAGRI